MYKRIIAFLALLLVLALSGCASVRTDTVSAPLRLTLASHLEADIRVGEKISGEAKITKFLWFVLGGDRKYTEGVNYNVSTNAGLLSKIFGDIVFEKAKAAAAYKALEGTGADAIVAPRYTVKVKDYFLVKVIHATVEGYAGYIQSIETNNDRSILQLKSGL